MNPRPLVSRSGDALLQIAIIGFHGAQKGFWDRNASHQAAAGRTAPRLER